ncbi:FG-GAP repeat protein [Streptomyces sp. NPDC002055]|uniref:FG-GAP repeat protein n=1 Tax=Streptomyces sp. NPDC002055 TaxID=3154534 RepID=UPI003331A9C7
MLPRLRTAALAVTLMLAPALPLAAPASAAPAKHYDDFNGDGHRDLAYSYDLTGSTTEGFSGGAVVVVYGTASGRLDDSRHQLIHQDSPGIPGSGEEDDSFGQELANADLNKDGYADLVVGNPAENRGKGSVVIVWGSARGLSGGTTLRDRTDTPYGFGTDLATGDFNGDGSPDIAAIGGVDTWLHRGPFTRSGRAGRVSEIGSSDFAPGSLAAGKVTADRRTDLVVLGVRFRTNRTQAWFFKGSAAGLAPGRKKTIDARRAIDRGPNAAIGDFDRDGYGDIALGDPDEDAGKGSVTLWYGASGGPSTSRRTVRLTQGTAGVTGAREREDRFGDALSAGDTNGDGYADLAVGVPGESVGSEEWAGGVTVFRGGSGGLKGTRSSWFAENSPGIVGTPAADDTFGNNVRLRDLNRDGRAELTVSAPGDDVGYVLPGTASGPSAAGSYLLTGMGSGFPN